MENERRRTRKKLELFEQEGLYGVLFDLISLLTEENHLDEVDNEWKRQMVLKLKEKYEKDISDDSKKTPRQQTLFD